MLPQIFERICHRWRLRHQKITSPYGVAVVGCPSPKDPTERRAPPMRMRARRSPDAVYTPSGVGPADVQPGRSLATGEARAGGPVVGWGSNASGQAQGSGTGASALSSGFSHSCAIRAGSGAVVCWGVAPFGEADVPASVNGTSGTASAIAAGHFQTCAIQAGSGIALCWGDVGFPPQAPPPAVNGTSGTASAIGAGFRFGCAIQAGSGAVVCWGTNSADRRRRPPRSIGTIGYGHGDLSRRRARVRDPGRQRRRDLLGPATFDGEATPPPAVNGGSGTASVIAAGFSHQLCDPDGQRSRGLLGTKYRGASRSARRGERNFGDGQLRSAREASTAAPIPTGSGVPICWGASVDRRPDAAPVGGWHAGHGQRDLHRDVSELCHPGGQRCGRLLVQRLRLERARLGRAGLRQRDLRGKRTQLCDPQRRTPRLLG